MPRRPPLALVAVVPLAVVLLAGCSRSLPPVRVAEPPGDPSCPALVRALPGSLSPGVDSRAVTPRTGTTAAWGEPAITLRCGVTRGNPLDEPYAFDGVRWVVHDDGATHRWTTVDRRVPVEVVIPDGYDGQAELLIGLSPALSVTSP